MNKFTYVRSYGTFTDCSFLVGHYANGNIGIEIWSDSQGPISKVTTNPDIEVPQNMIAIKNYSENEGMVDWLVSIGMIEDTPVHTIASGFVEIPIHKLTDKGLETLGLNL